MRLAEAGHAYVRLKPRTTLDLKRAAAVEPFEPRLTVAGMYRYMADSGVFTDCSTGRRMEVAQERDNAALESAYTKARKQPGEALKVLVDARLASRPNPDTGREQPALIVERFISVSPGDTCGELFSPSPLERTYWRAASLAGTRVAGGDASREAHFILDPGGHVAGSDGCNRVVGGYQLRGDAITFGSLAATRMACPGTGDIERAFYSALSRANRWRIVGDRLELLDTTGARVARFEARHPGN